MRCITINSYKHTHTNTLYTPHSGYINGRIDRGTIAKRDIHGGILHGFLKITSSKKVQMCRRPVSLDSQRGTAASRCNRSWKINFCSQSIFIVRFILFMPCPVSASLIKGGDWNWKKYILIIFERVPSDSLNQRAPWLIARMFIFTYFEETWCDNLICKIIGIIN